MSNSVFFGFIDEVSQKHYGDKSLVEEINENNRILMQEKEQVKIQAISKEYDKLLLEYLGKDPEKWPSKDEVDAQLKACKAERRKVKQQLEDEKDKIAEALKPVVEEFSNLQSTVKVLHEKLVLLESKKSDFQSKRHIDPETVDDSIEKCQACIKKVESEIGRKKESLQTLKTSIDDLRSQLSMKNKVQTGSQRRDREKSFELAKKTEKVLSFLETVTNIKVQILDADRILLNFLGGNQDLNLTLTLTLTAGYHGNTRLKDVQVNVSDFKIDDIIAVAKETNDVPYLVRKTQERWQQHFPVLSEMNLLIKQHAVDWIQEQSKLRVLSKCGKIMFTLNIPKDYPQSRDITLDKVVGLDDLTDLELPQPPASLLQWVEFLEEKYGNS